MAKTRHERSEEKQGVSRRRFIGGSLAAIAGAGLQGRKNLFGKDSDLSGNESKALEYRTLGRTGFRVADIGFGAGELEDSALFEAILDSGVNYIDTAESYGRGRSERVIGEVLKKRDRKGVFVTTKIGFRGKTTKESVVQRANRCLERLQTDYVDCLMIHGPATAADLNNSAFHEAVKDLRAEGKVKYIGISNHGSQWQDAPETMEKVCLAAAEDGRFDVMLFVYNFIQKEMAGKILAACRKHNVGATLMKTNPLLNYLEMKENAERVEKERGEMPPFLKNLLPRLKEKADKAEAFKKEYGLTGYEQIRDAAIKFVLSHPDVSCACPTIKNYDDLEAYTALSGKKLLPVEQNVLAAYQSVFGDLYCRHACGACESSCPQAVPVNTIMRYFHYFKGQGREKSAMVKYAGLSTKKADACARCTGHCEQACPYGVPVQGLLSVAHDTLILA
jgi:aryl-alcohol dehydrogenase-like predicted oxidoreductase